MESELLAFDSVAYSYPNGRKLSDLHPALRPSATRDLTFRVGAGERVALLGSNGSGKTTLLKLANGLLRPDAGEVRWRGEPLDRSRAGLAKLRSRVGLLFQDPDDQLFAPSLLQDAAFGPLNQGVAAEEARERGLAQLAKVGLGEFADLPPHVLSHGMRKRAALAGVLALDPALLLLDEPSAGLDPSSEERLLAVLDDFHSRGGASLLSTHDLGLARRLADRVLVLDQGRIVAQGDVREILDDAELLRRCGLERGGRPFARAQGGRRRSPSAPRPSRLLVLTGDGKGKTSSGCGMLLRAVGHGQTAILARFVKMRPSAEIAVLERIGVRILGGGRGFLPEETESVAFARHVEAACDAWEAVESALRDSTPPALLVLDEICYALAKGLLERDRVEACLSVRRPGVSVVCTGRGAPQWLRNLADTVSEVECRRHGFQDGIPATEGVEL